jgi:hypothetical protein
MTSRPCTTPRLPLCLLRRPSLHAISPSASSCCSGLAKPRHCAAWPAATTAPHQQRPHPAGLSLLTRPRIGYSDHLQHTAPAPAVTSPSGCQHKAVQRQVVVRREVARGCLLLPVLVEGKQRGERERAETSVPAAPTYPCSCSCVLCREASAERVLAVYIPGSHMVAPAARL